MEIKTESLTLRIASDQEIVTLITEQTEEDLKNAYIEMLSGCEEHPELRQWYAPWIVELHSGERIGDIGFKGLSSDGMVEIGYGFTPEFWGKGYATEAVTAAVKWASEQPEVKQIEAETEPNNFASQRVLSKAGFVPLGKNGEEGPRFVKSVN